MTDETMASGTSASGAAGAEGGTRCRRTTSRSKLGVDPASGLSAAKAAELLQTERAERASRREADRPGGSSSWPSTGRYMQIILVGGGGRLDGDRRDLHRHRRPR